MSSGVRFPVISAAFLLFLGCFNTNGIESGGLTCGEKDGCPDGFVCNKDLDVRGKCVRKGTVSTSTSTSTAIECKTATAPFGPFPNCTPPASSASACDPVCQTGCPCKHRCVTDNSVQSFFCESAEPASTLVRHMDKCTANAANAGSNCVPGALCLDDGSASKDVCGSYCYQTCRADADCPANTRCTKAKVVPVDSTTSTSASVALCSPPIETCNPLNQTSCLGKPGFTCVLMASLTGIGDETTCDCKSLHTVPIGGKCLVDPDDCAPGSACVAGTCRQLCLLGSGAACPSKECKNPVYGSTKYGWCN